MRILLIDPRNCWRGLSISLAYLSAALKKEGIDVFVLDMANHRNIKEDILERYYIDKYQPDLIGISLFYIGYYPVKNMIKRIKSFSNVPIVVGGPQMMIEKENILKDIDELDFAIIGDGEKALVELCNSVVKGGDYSNIDGLVFRRDGVIIKNKDSMLADDIDNIPFPDYEVFGIKKIRTYSIITSRGCPYSCSYCFRSSPKWRPRSPSNIIQELENAIRKYGIEEFAIIDDSFNVLPKRVMEFCDLLLERKWNLPWYCSGIRADRVTDELILKMKQAGCHSISIGIETLNRDVYKTLNRGMDLDQVIQCVDILKKYNMTVSGYFMIGLPGETKETIMDTYNKSRKLGVDNTNFSLLLPFPGTKMYDNIYNLPGVRKLHDYRTVSTVWTFTEEFSHMKTAFDTAEFPEKDKINAYNKFKTMRGDPRPPYNGNKLLFALNCICFILKYDFVHFPVTVYRLAKNVITRFKNARGKHVYKADFEYSEDINKEMELLERMQSR